VCVVSMEGRGIVCWDLKPWKAKARAPSRWLFNDLCLDGNGHGFSLCDYMIPGGSKKEALGTSCQLNNLVFHNNLVFMS
jgi:hypothetical protein